MIYVGHCSIIEANNSGVHSRNTQRLFFDPDLSVYCLRPTDRPSDDVRKQVCDEVRTLIGTSYGTWDAIKAGLGVASRESSKQFCSRLVAEAYSSKGVQLFEDPAKCRPKDLLSSPSLSIIDNVTVEIDDTEVQAWEQDLSIPDLMEETTNQVLNKVRPFYSSVQTLNDVDKLVLEQPHLDPAVNKIFQESGYLSVWAVECEKNPWHYDLALMRSMASQNFEGVEWYCKNTLGEGTPPDHRYSQNCAVYRYYCQHVPRLTFHSLLALYLRLEKLHRQRLAVVNQWLAL